MVHRIFGASDPFFYPIFDFEGSLGQLSVCMTVSRKYLLPQSGVMGTLASILYGETIPLAGFGTLETTRGTRQLQPLVFASRDADRF